MTPEQTLEWLAQQHFDQCREERPIQDWIRKMKSQLPEQPAVSETNKQDPVAHVCVFPLRGDEFFPQTRIEWKNGRPVAGPLYTTPPTQQSCSQRTWVGLTDEEIIDCASDLLGDTNALLVIYFARAIEDKLKAKNERKENNI